MSLCPEILRERLNLNFDPLSLRVNGHSDDCSFIVVIVTQSSLKWVRDKTEGEEVQVKMGIEFYASGHCIMINHTVMNKKGDEERWWRGRC